MTTDIRSFEEAKWFTSIAEEKLEGLTKASLFFSVTHFLNKNDTRSTQKKIMSEAVAGIVSNFDPDHIEVDEVQPSFMRPGTIAVWAANVGFDSNNPLYDIGLPNVFVSRTNDDLSKLDLQYIEDHKDRGFSATPSMQPAVSFTELSAGEFELDLGAWAPASFEIPIRHAERLARVVQLIGKRICSPNLRPDLVIRKSV